MNRNFGVMGKKSVATMFNFQYNCRSVMTAEITCYSPAIYINPTLHYEDNYDTGDGTDKDVVVVLVTMAMTK